MHTLISSLRRVRVLIVAVLALVAVAAVIIPTTATSKPWQWQDHSELLATRTGTTVSLVSERSGTWLVSDGIKLYRYDGSTIVDLTAQARSREITSIANIFSDGRNWLIYSRVATERESVLWLTDGYSWTNVSKVIPANNGIVSAAGMNGEWFLRAYTQATAYDPAYWTLFRWNGTTDKAVAVSLPAEVDARAAGCFTNSATATFCQGENQVIAVNGHWYLLGGRTEVRNSHNVTTQAPQAGMWMWQNNTWAKMADLPPFRYVSGVWSGKETALIATSNTTNPFTSDQFWQFDGTTLEEMSDQALRTGLLSVDAREIRAASNGRSWMILVGKRLVRFDGAIMSSHGETRDFFTTISGGSDSVFVLGGAVSEAGSTFMTMPLTAKLVYVKEVSTITKNNPISEVFSKVRGPRVTVRGIPKDAHVTDGQSFTLRAEASDTDGVAQTSIYVNGARLKTCTGSVCELTQTFWANGQKSRTIPLFARSMDKQGFTNDSATIILTIEKTVSEVSDGTRLQKGLSLPVNTTWTKDAQTGTSWTSWHTAADKRLDETTTSTIFSVAALNEKGLGRVELWINGDVKRTCDFTSSLDIRVCSLSLSASDYPANSEVYANARIYTSKDRDTQVTWTTGLHILRGETTPGIVRTATIGSAPAIQHTVVSLTPDVTTVRRGTQAKVRVTAQNSAAGIRRIEVYLNNAIERVCTLGGQVSPTSCDLDLDTTKYPSGTTISVVARVLDGEYHFSWSNTRALYINDSMTQTTPDPAQNSSVSIWSWMTPLATELHAGDRVSYSIGAWSAENVQKIDMIVDGAVRKSCNFTSTDGNKECTIMLADTDFADRHVATLNARATDAAGNKGWSEVRTIKVVRDWLPTPESQPSYLTIENDHPKGYALGESVTLTARAWSAMTIARIEIRANNRVVATCPSDVCTWKSPAMSLNQLEYQAQALDSLGRSLWTGVIGVSSK